MTFIGPPPCSAKQYMFYSKTFSEKGDDLYNQEKDRYLAKMVKRKTEVNMLLQSASWADVSDDKEALETSCVKLPKAFHKYETSTSDFASYLTRKHTDDYLREKSAHLMVLTQLGESVSAACRDIDVKLAGLMSKVSPDNIQQKAPATTPTDVKPEVTLTSRPTPSLRSSKSRKSKSSTALTDADIFKQRLKAEAAKAGLDFERKEFELMKESARALEEELRVKAAAERRKLEIEAEMRLLVKQKEAAVAEAEYKACFDTDIEGSISDHSLPGSEEDSGARTEKYVRSLREESEKDEQSVLSNDMDPFRDRANSFPSHISETLSLDNRNKTNNPRDIHITSNKLNPEAQAFNPGEKQGYTDFTRFLLRKDLLLQRFTTFDDKPETFGIWKTSFQSIISELCVSPSEEFDLLIKWLGPESRRSAVSLRAANVNNPSKGITRLWERLHERYGCPEMVESSLRDKLAKFPKLGNTDNAKLYELSDILSEIECAMEDPKYASLLSYFNTSSGVLPIACKLPFHIQGKWAMKTTRYKRDHKVAFSAVL